jgi:hypothetical protein
LEENGRYADADMFLLFREKARQFLKREKKLVYNI